MESDVGMLAVEAWSRGNPFNVTKATDLTDDEIQSMWVDLATDGGYLSVIDPKLAMPRVLLGGKGTGRTHLMRFLSAPVQRVRNPATPYAGAMSEGYLGIYLRCTGLNAGRFCGKGIPDDTWEAVFTYSMDLWLARVALDTAASSFMGLKEFDEAERAIAEGIAAIFDDYGHTAPAGLGDLRKHLKRIQAELDIAVNNAALTRSLGDVTIRTGRGRLPFELPQVIQKHVGEIADLRWLYLVDELENLTLDQQKYIQTLIREREEPTSFIVGARTYGFRTSETLSAGEENKVGSEYDPVELDHIYLQNPKRFGSFCREIVAKRLADAGYKQVSAAKLARFFVEPDTSQVGRDEEVEFVREQDETERRYLRKLRKQLEQFHHLTADDASSVVDQLRMDEHPLIERLSVLLLYQSWNQKGDIAKHAERIGREARAYMQGETAERFHQSYGHWSGDVLARLLQEYREKQRYLGLDAFIHMAGGLPRNLLVILKNVVRAAEFNGERPFRDAPIAEASQRAGVVRAAEWFFRDARALGAAGVKAERGVNRLGDLLRALRFADKPPEASLSTVSFAFDSLNAEGKEVVRTARGWSLLLAVPEGQRDKNTAGIKEKYQLNPMLCPRWDLPIYRRGALDLNAADATAIFGDEDEAAFDRLRSVRVRRANMPFRADGGGKQETLIDDGS